jgi:hypothetical protein
MTRDPVTRFLLDEPGYAGTSAAGPSLPRRGSPAAQQRTPTGTPAGRDVPA